jgi:hypothetical protein
MNARSTFLKRRALPFIFSVAGVFLALFAAANPDTLSRENSPQIDPKTFSPRGWLLIAAQFRDIS